MKYIKKENNVVLEFESATFSIDALEAQAKAEQIQEVLAEATKGSENKLVNDEILLKMKNAGRKALDILLGDNSSKKILDDKASYYDIMDCYYFITEKVNKKCAEKAAEYSSIK